MDKSSICLLTLHAAHHVQDPDEPTRLAGCGIVIVAIDEFARCHRRQFAYGLSNSHNILAGLQAVRLALSSIRPGQRTGKSMLVVNTGDIYKLLHNPDEPVPIDCVDVLKEVRRWVGFFPQLDITIAGSTDTMMQEALTLAAKAAATQIDTDSGTTFQ